MPRLTSTLPKYRKHRASGQAVVTLSGQDFYLGPHGTKASKMEYDRLVSEWLQCGRCLPKPEAEITVVELLAAYKKFSQAYYRKNGKPTREAGLIVEASKHVIALYGRTSAADFGPRALQVIQNRMVEAGLARNTVNDHVGRIKRAFKWAVSQELIPPENQHALSSVGGLKKGRTTAHEPEPVEPVADAIVNATLEKLTTVVADMVSCASCTTYGMFCKTNTPSRTPCRCQRQTPADSKRFQTRFVDSIETCKRSVSILRSGMMPTNRTFAG